MNSLYPYWFSKTSGRISKAKVSSSSFILMGSEKKKKEKLSPKCKNVILLIRNLDYLIQKKFPSIQKWNFF